VTALEGFWLCQECGGRTDEPHTAPDGGDTCPSCCVACTSGETYAAQEQWLLDRGGAFNPGDPVMYHGIASQAQCAEAEAAAHARQPSLLDAS
jgi:hypothetical protein